MFNIHICYIGKSNTVTKLIMKENNVLLYPSPCMPLPTGCSNLAAYPAVSLSVSFRTLSTDFMLWKMFIDLQL